MTVAVAVRKHKSCVIAADSLVNFGGQRFPSENCRFNKIYHIGDSLMVWAGWSLYGELLDAYLAARNPAPALTTEQDVFTFFLQPLFAWGSRRHEYEADSFAASTTSAGALASALVKLYRDNAATLTPDPVYSAFYDSHPPALRRISRLLGKP